MVLIPMSTAAAAAAQPAREPRANRQGVRMPDPVTELRFKITVDPLTTIGQFAECSGLSAEYEIFEYQEGGVNDFTHKLRGRVKWPNLVLKRGVTYQDAFLKWFFESRNTDRKKRGTIELSLLDDTAKEVRKWTFAGAFPVKWQGPTLNAKGNNIATESLEIAHQGLLKGV